MIGSSVTIPTVAVIGAGPAGLMAAETLAANGLNVTVYDRMPSAGRKFLLAGRGGLNLTHSEGLPNFLDRYWPLDPRLADAIAVFSPDDVRRWSEGLGEATFVGSSGKVFPSSFKASPLLRAWLRRLADRGVGFAPRHCWSGWREDGAPLILGPEGPIAERPDASLLALGGATWPHLGSDAAWIQPFARSGLAVSTLRPANCGFVVGWSAPFAARHAGTALKSIGLVFGGASSRGEAMITRQGLEGGAIYALGRLLREAIVAEGSAVLHVDLRPDLSRDAVAKRIAAQPSKQSRANILRKALKLSPASVGLLREAEPPIESPASADPSLTLADAIKALPLRLVAPAPIDRAISTAGGVAWSAIDDNFMLRGRPGTFVAGEMIDWEAPTGGYLLQACFATGVAAARGLSRWLGDAPETAGRAFDLENSR